MFDAIKRLYARIAFGPISERIVDTISEGTVCEIEYTDQHGNVVGYWAYGSYDPSLPYQGQSWWPTG